MRKRLLVYFMIILFFGVVITGYLSYRFTEDMTLKNTEDNLKSETRLVEDEFRYSYVNKDTNYDNLAKQIEDKIGKRVTIIRSDGKVIGESDKPSSLLENHSGRPEVKAALKTGEGISIRYSTTVKKTMCYYAVRFTSNNGDVFIIRLSVQFIDIQNVQQRYLKLLIASIIIGIIMCTIAAYFYVNSFTQPIRMLTRLATTIALGQYEKKINITSNDEIGQLGHAFNLMAKRLKETITDLSDKQNKLISVLTSMDDGVIVVDNNEKIILINPASQKLFQVQEEATGKYFIEVIRNYDIQEIIKTLPEEDVEIKINYPASKTLRIKSTRVINYDVNNENLGVMLFIQDITRVKTLEEMRSDFVANVSHELRSPLTSIKGFAETLKYVEDKPTREKFLDIIYIESERLTRLINDILTLSELENKDSSVNFEKIDIKKSIEEIFYIMEPMARGKNISLELEICDEELFIYGDRDKVKQMMINLVDNAIKYTNEGGKVVMDLSSENGRIKIRVIDNGIGIPEENIPRLFERFYRVDKARSRKMGGTGLGLAIVKHIAMILNGEIEVKSKPGQGTVFTIYLPSVNSKLA